ncbi:unnamed protein product [Sphagnum balticum]
MVLLYALATARPPGLGGGGARGSAIFTHKQWRFCCCNNSTLVLNGCKPTASFFLTARNSGGGGGDGWVQKNDAVVRNVPLVLGSLSMLGILINRSVSGVALVADASSAQSRADVLVLALATTALLQGLVWKSIQPRAVISVQLEGVECFRIAASLPQAASQELQWVWEALSSTTRSQALVVVYGDACALQAGMAAESGDASGDAQTIDVHQLLNGSLCRQARETETQNYLANLALYPGRFQLLFLPSNTQAVIIQPLGEDGVLIAASNTIRGYTSRDKAWIAMIGEKLDTTLRDWALSSSSSSSSSSNVIATNPLA